MTGHPDQPNSPRHADLKASWRPGQQWETLVEGCDQWVPVGDRGFAEPTWDHRQEYRQIAEPAAATEPSAPAGTVRVGWICRDDLAQLLQNGSAMLYQERQEFRLLGDVEQFEVFVRAPEVPHG